MNIEERKESGAAFTALSNTTPIDFIEPVEAMSVKDALAVRDRLVAKFAEIEEIRQARGEKVKALEIEIKVLRAEQAQANESAAQDGLDVPKVNNVAQIGELNDEIEQLNEMRAPAKLAAKKVAQELYLHSIRQWKPLAEHAEKLSADAVEALAKIKGDYIKAFNAWMVAAQEWDPLVNLHNTGRQVGVRHTGERNIPAELAPPADPPIADPRVVFNTPPPAPAEIQ